ncbi:MAG: glycosyltransferase family 87 protein [Desulfobaccales bacterium]
MRGFTEKRASLYLYALFFGFLLLSGYGSLIMGFYWTVSELGTRPELTDTTGQPAGRDFVAFWAASYMARTGNPAAIYSLPQIHRVEEKIIGTSTSPYAWNYPPVFLLMILPLSLLPYLASLIFWLLTTLTGYFLTIRSIVPNRLAPWIFLGFPVVTTNFFYGQNGFLSATLMGSGLLLLDRYPFTGGLLLGLMSYKPQLATLIPIALAVGGCWRALGGAVAAAVGAALASLLVFGSGTWMAFWHNLSFASGLMDKSIYWSKMPTVFAACRLAGASFPVAVAFQGASTLGISAVVCWVWRCRPPLAMKASILTVGIFLATPYAFECDLAVLGPAFAWLGWEEYSNGRLHGQVFLICCWLGIDFAKFFPWRTVFQVNPLILLALVLFILSRTGLLEKVKFTYGTARA